MNAPSLAPGPVSHNYVSQRLKLHYAQWGDPAAPPLVLVHGGRDHCRSWDWVAAALARDWHVIAPDLRGHGDSDWVSDGNYATMDMVYDLRQLVRQLDAGPVSIVAHSWGGNVATRFAAVCPDLVTRLLAIEGLGPSPAYAAELAAKPFAARVADWLDAKHAAAARQPRRYASIAEACARMHGENAYLTPAQAQHLTIHGVNRNEDGSYSWKFDPHLNIHLPFETATAEVEQLWAAIACPTLLVYGATSWASNPARDGRARHFRTAEVIEIADAGHWVHHDQFDAFMATTTAFLAR